MFQRFTEGGRQVVVLAQAEARGLCHDYIGTEHILLGLLVAEEGLAARALSDLGLTVERVRDHVVRIVGRGKAATPGQIPFTPRAKKVMESALREALSLGHNHIGSEHLLLAVVRDGESVATRILLDFDADPEKVRNKLIRLLSGPSGRHRPGGSQPPRLEFDPPARLAIELAKHEAASLGHERVGTEHLLLGLQLSGQGLAAVVLGDLGVTIERARPLLIAIAGSSERRPAGEMPLTPAARKAIERATQEALELGAQAVGTEHVLLSLVRDHEGVLGRMLLELDTSPQQIRRQALRLTHPRPRSQTVRLPPPTEGLDWNRATLLWRPEGLEMRVPLRMSAAQMAAFAADEVWSSEPLAGARRELWTGWLALASPTLLQVVGDPAQLRRSLDAAAKRARDTAERAADDFLDRLRADP